MSVNTQAPNCMVPACAKTSGNANELKIIPQVIKMENSRHVELS